MALKRLGIHSAQGVAEEGVTDMFTRENPGVLAFVLAGFLNGWQRLLRQRYT